MAHHAGCEHVALDLLNDHGGNDDDRVDHNTDCDYRHRDDGNGDDDHNAVTR